MHVPILGGLKKAVSACQRFRLAEIEAVEVFAGLGINPFHGKTVDPSMQHIDEGIRSVKA